MKVVLTSAGSRGDVQPLQALAIGLKVAGHTVTLCASPDFAPSSSDLGIPFVPVGRETRKLLKEHFASVREFPLAAPRPFRQEMRREMNARFDGLAEVARGADLLVASSLEFSAATVAENQRLPYRYLLLCPAVLPSRKHAPWVVPWRTLPGWTNRLLWWVTDVAFRQVVMKEINIRRRRMKMPAAPLAARHVFGRRPILAADDVFGTVPPDVPIDVVQTASLQLPVRGRLPGDLEDFLGAGEPPVYFGFGSMFFRNRDRLGDLVAEAVRRLGRRAVISAGWGGLGERLSRDDIMVVDDVPHGLLFPRVAAVVHHGGAGTTATAARAGVPQVVVPNIMDQFHWAERVHGVGLGPEPLFFRRLTASRLTGAVEAAIRDGGIAERCREVAEELSSRDGVADTVAALV
jgi:UDP:flavonoid glycosyltransferase YjiC (YdhE family)